MRIVERRKVVFRFLAGMSHNHAMPQEKPFDSISAKAKINLGLSRFPLDTLPGFVAAANALSFTQAAADLQLTQSAISKQVKTLEDAIGHSLFKRATSAGGRLELTDAGRTFYLCAKEILGSVETTLLRINRNHGSALSISTTPSLASLWLVPRLSLLKEALGGIDVLLDARDDTVNLEASGVDIAIRLMRGTASHDEERVMPLGYEYATLVCAPDLMQGNTPLTSIAAINQHTLLAYEDSRGLFPWLTLDAWLAGLVGENTANIKPKAVIRFTHYEQVIRAAAAGLGFAIGRKPLVDQYLERGELVAPFAKRLGSEPELPHRYHIVISAAALGKPSTAAFVQWIKTQL
jgi:LysR family transcriptional regulator, glycine cleavage system transcriptional activator